MSAYELPARVPRWNTETFSLAGREIQLAIPADPDQLLDDPEVLKESELNDYVPYWGYLWPAARCMAQRVAAAEWPKQTRVLELGCGSGLIGLAALAAGMHVTFSDNRPEALQLSGYNAQQNGFENFDVALLDWLKPETSCKYPVVIASDVLYETKFHQPLLQLIPRILEEQGEFWLGDPGRSVMLDFLRLAEAAGFEREIFDEAGTPCLFPRAGAFQLFVFRNAESV